MFGHWPLLSVYIYNYCYTEIMDCDEQTDGRRIIAPYEFHFYRFDNGTL